MFKHLTTLWIRETSAIQILTNVFSKNEFLHSKILKIFRHENSCEYTVRQKPNRKHKKLFCIKVVALVSSNFCSN